MLRGRELRHRQLTRAYRLGLYRIVAAAVWHTAYSAQDC